MNVAARPTDKVSTKRKLACTLGIPVAIFALLVVVALMVTFNAVATFKFLTPDWEIESAETIEGR